MAFGVAMEGGLLDFGDGAGVIRILKEDVGTGTPLGRILGGGAGNVGRALGPKFWPVRTLHWFAPAGHLRDSLPALAVEPSVDRCTCYPGTGIGRPDSCRLHGSS